jgi:hypothetical protein
MRRPSLVLLALAAAVALAGCLGSVDDLVDDEDLGVQSADGPTDVPDDAPDDVGAPDTEGIVHAPNGTGAVADELPGGAPVGIAQLTGHPSFEPTIGVTSEGDLFMSNVGGQFATGHSSIVRSTDQGGTWEDVTPSIGPASSPPTTFDPYVYVDGDTDRVYNLDMEGLQCNYVQWSDDGGESWTQNPLGCGQPLFQDHPTIFAGPPTTLETAGYENVVYICVNRVGDAACAVSLDGGVTWSPWRTVFPGEDPKYQETDPGDPLGSAASGFCGGLHGHGVAGPDGTAYLPKGQCGVPEVAVSHDNGLTWTRHVVSEDVGVTSHEVRVTTDSEGNVYAAWIGDDLQPYMAASTDQGESWSDPVVVSPKSVGTTDFPAIDAVEPGKVAIAYIGTSAEVPYSVMGHNDTWNAYITTSTDALSEDPTFATAPVNPPSDPIARGDCSNFSRCYADDGGALGDFIDVNVGPDGRPWAAFVDACTEGCANGTEPSNDEGVGMVGTYAEGPSLRGDGALPSLPWADLGAEAP